MSIGLMLDLYKIDLPLTCPQKAVLNCLAYYTKDSTGIANPSYTTIAKKCCLGRRSVIRAIEQLIFMKLIIKIQDKDNKFERNQYQITFSPSVRESLGWCQEDTRGGVTESPNLINDLIIDLKENIIKEKIASENSAPFKPSLSSLRNTAKDVLSFLRKKTGRNYQPVDSNLKPIIYLLKDGITSEQCRQVIARKHRDWGHDPKFEKYLRPSTLFNKTNFHSKYLPECITDEERKKIMKEG